MKSLDDENVLGGGYGPYGEARRAQDEQDIAALTAAKDELEREAIELRALFELQRSRTQEAVALWRREDPKVRANTIPDLGDLLTWLMERAGMGVSTEFDEPRQFLKFDVTDMPPAWRDLLQGIAILAQHPSDEISPFNCTHDQLAVMADEGAFSPEQIALLERLGFTVDSDGGFYSFRFGSA